jgi:hypothetical protein
VLSDKAEAALRSPSSGDDLIVIEAKCVGLSPARTGEAGRFDCAAATWRRRPSVAPARWIVLERAVASGSDARVRAALGVPAGADDATVGKIVGAWGIGSPRIEMIGLQVIGRKTWRRVEPSMTVSQLEAYLANATAVRAAIPAIEAFYSDRSSYQGLTTAALRREYDRVSPRLRIVRAATERYCVELGVGRGKAHIEGPDAVSAPGPCTAPAAATAYARSRRGPDA